MDRYGRASFTRPDARFVCSLAASKPMLRASPLKFCAHTGIVTEHKATIPFAAHFRKDLDSIRMVAVSPLEANTLGRERACHSESMSHRDHRRRSLFSGKVPIPQCQVNRGMGVAPCS